MLTATLTITIPGDPATKGSMKCVGRRGQQAHVLIESHETSDPWRKVVVSGLRKFPEEQRAAVHQPLGAEVSFTLERPKEHYGTGRNAGVLKAWAVDRHPVGHNTGDGDKLVRLIFDALQDAKVIPDDAVIVEHTARKGFVGSELLPDLLPWPGVRIRLFPIA